MLDVRYIAGFFDGEGTIFIGRGKRKRLPTAKTRTGCGWHLVVSLANSYAPVLDEIASNYGAKRLQYQFKEGMANKPCYNLRFKSQDAYRFLKDIYPYLVVKRAQAALAIQFAEYIHARKAGFALTPAEIAERNRFREAIQILNMRTGKRGTATVNKK